LLGARRGKKMTAYTGPHIDRLITKDDLRAPGEDLLREMRRLARELIVSLSITMAALNGIVFLALELD
jgi:hypothetical protein